MDLQYIRLGIISVLSFFIFIIYQGIHNLATHGMSKIFQQMKWWSFDVATIAGVFTMGLMAQSLIVPIVKNNANQSKNKRDIRIGNLY
jgi:sodium-coupled neutral amino acid transporter 9